MVLLTLGPVGAESKDHRGHFPQEEEPTVLRDQCEVKLQFRETVPVVGKEASRVCYLFFFFLVASCRNDIIYLATARSSSWLHLHSLRLRFKSTKHSLHNTRLNWLLFVLFHCASCMTSLLTIFINDRPRLCPSQKKTTTCNLSIMLLMIFYLFPTPSADTRSQIHNLCLITPL